MNQIDHRIQTNILHIAGKNYPMISLAIEKRFSSEEKNEFLQFTNDIVGVIEHLKRVKVIEYLKEHIKK